MTTDAGGVFNDVMRNLLSLEVNTIVKDNMTAEPMSTVAHALLDIAGEYAGRLEEYGVNLAGYFPENGVDPFPGEAGSAEERERFRPADGLWNPLAARLDMDLLTVSRGCFERLRCAAKAAGKEAPQRTSPRLRDGEMLIIERICNNCDAIKWVMQRTPALDNAAVTQEWLQARPDAGASLSADMTGADYLMIRKIWEVGTEDVVLQTVIHLDGDVVNRVRAFYLDQPEASALFKMHEMGTGVAVRGWEHLINLVQEVATGAFNAFRRVL